MDHPDQRSGLEKGVSAHIRSELFQHASLPGGDDLSLHFGYELLNPADKVGFGNAFAGTDSAESLP